MCAVEQISEGLLCFIMKFMKVGINIIIIIIIIILIHVPNYKTSCVVNVLF